MQGERKTLIQREGGVALSGGIVFNIISVIMIIIVIL